MPQPPLPPLPPPVVLPAVPVGVEGLAIEELGLMTNEEMLTSQQMQFMVRCVDAWCNTTCLHTFRTVPIYTYIHHHKCVSDHPQTIKQWSPGSKGAHKVLSKFLSSRLHRFQHDRAKTDRHSTSRLSPHLHFGEISVRYIYYMVKQKQAAWDAQGGGAGTSCDDFLQQVGYREYSRYLSWHFPFTHERSLLEHVRACPYRIDQGLFKVLGGVVWCGCVGLSVVCGWC